MIKLILFLFLASYAFVPVAFGGQPSQVIVFLPKTTYPTGIDYTSPTVNVTTQWRRFNIETINTPAEWLAVANSFRITVYCAQDKVNFTTYMAGTFLGGTLGKFGQTPIMAMSIPHQNMPPMSCNLTLKSATPTSVFVGFQVTDIPK